ncbi:MAG: DJ-1/PfpI family protein [Candidatus Diapherotrites archaeon]|nr:DJ-1/PfpI family protein [Candidatus Diapherotrites archaeon]
MARVLFVIAPKDFRDEELFHTKEELEKAGHECVIASIQIGTCTGSRGGIAEASLDLAHVRAGDFDSVVFVGGGGARVYFNHKIALDLARDFLQGLKPTAAICIAPTILGNAGLLKGKKVTSFHSQESALRGQGALFSGKPVESDGLLVTANGPEAARAFGQKLAQLLA